MTITSRIPSRDALYDILGDELCGMSNYVVLIHASVVPKGDLM